LQFEHDSVPGLVGIEPRYVDIEPVSARLKPVSGYASGFPRFGQAIVCE
jgi:hypothetical protein